MSQSPSRRLSHIMKPAAIAVQAARRRLRKLFRLDSEPLWQSVEEPLGPQWEPTTTDIVASLAQEIVDKILENLRGDRRSLRMTSTVSRSWNHASVRLLFRHFTIHQSNLGDVDMILKSPLDVASHIQSLSIKSLHHSLDLPQLQRVLHGVPALRSLTLDLMSGNLASPFVPGFREALPSLSIPHLQLSSQLLLDVDTTSLSALLSLFSSVGELKVVAETYRDLQNVFSRLSDQPGPLPSPLQPLLRIKRVVIDERCGDFCTLAVLRMLKWAADLDAITSFSFRAPILFSRLVIIINRWVKLPKNLEEVSIFLNRNSTADNIFRDTVPRRVGNILPESNITPKFSSCPSLCRMSIGFDLFDYGHGTSPYAQWDLALEQLRSASLSLAEINMRIRVSLYSCQYAEEGVTKMVRDFWAKLRASGNLGLFPKLKAVNIVCDTYGHTYSGVLARFFHAAEAYRDDEDKGGYKLTFRVHEHHHLEDDSETVMAIRIA